jgi:hypothetical protein
MLTPLSALTSKQAAPPTENTMQDCLQFLNYAASQEDAIITYQGSDMKLAIHSNTSYLLKPKACSRAGSHMFMAGTEEIPINNGAVLNILQIIKAVKSTAAEAELGALFINIKTGVSMQQTFEELGHPQPRTPIQTDNSTAHALLTNKILPKALKAMDMRFHWLRCRAAQDQFCYYWRPGTQNLADYWTKHHPASHHKSFHPQIFDVCYRSRIHRTDWYSKDQCFQIIRQTCPKVTTLDRTNSCKRKDTSSPKRLRAQRQGCVRLTQTGQCTQYMLGKCTYTIIWENVHVQLSEKMYIYNYPGKCTCVIIQENVHVQLSLLGLSGGHIGNRISLNAIPTTLYSVVTISHKNNTMTSFDTKARKDGSLPLPPL